MRVALRKLEVVTKQTVETVLFTAVTFLHGPVGSGKSTVARLIDFCFGGDLIETPALQSEFVAARLFATIGDSEVVFERDRLSSSAARVTWRSSAPGYATEHPRSVLAPFSGERGVELLEGVVGIENLSDLIFHLANVRPIRVRKNKRDADAKLVRLSFRDLLFYCYLDQDNLDSSFFAFDHPFKKQKSIDAMRFFVGFYSERLNDQEQRLYRAIEEQRTKRSMADQLSSLFKDLKFSNQAELEFQLYALSQNRTKIRAELEVVEGRRSKQSHPLDGLRSRLRELAERVNAEEESLASLNEKVLRRESLKAELVTAKVKALRARAAQRVLSQVEFQGVLSAKRL